MRRAGSPGETRRAVDPSCRCYEIGCNRGGAVKESLALVAASVVEVSLLIGRLDSFCDHGVRLSE